MPDKKKLHFWQLVFVFGAITILALASSYGYSQVEQAGMMKQSMGNMMSSMHLKDIKIGDLIKQRENMEGMTGQSMASHHQGSESFLKTAHYLTTATIILLLPFIIAGTVFLTIIWLK